ncbi:PAS domain-containing sensor histidine kinase [Reichenbachiella ulvae]|uniref:histidine kinase n=1 Tax=Reichenbachiella ulvae TaxID=2980104 RepID=A0ABT3CRW3_9BACT|nr:PAS domain-containing sensor histidine kinase [Reichenbachiella ulvae]MCV9386229.1 PAS domain-containing sensor histidine kinase [Reichenbachiella ulvae]
MSEVDQQESELSKMKEQNDFLQKENQALKKRLLLQSQIEEKLRKSDQRFKILLDHLPGVAYLCLNDDRYSMLLVNDAVEVVTGYTRQDFLDDRISFVELYHPGDEKKIGPIVEKAIENKEVFNIVYRIKHKDGHWRWIEESGSGIFNGDNLEMLEGYLTDITDRVLAEEAMKKNNYELKIAKERAEESDRLKTKFLNNMSHEVRTPMNAIVGFSDLLLNEDLTHQDREKYVGFIHKSCRKLLTVINDIMDISQLETKQVVLKNTHFSLYKLMCELHDKHLLEAKAKGLHLILNNSHPDQSELVTDRGLLSRIMSSLIENAVKFTKSGEVKIGYEITETHYQIYVADTGLGIKMEMQEKIFDRFLQDVSEGGVADGLGLGLSLAREYGQLLGASLTVDSEPGKGSVFTLIFPLGNGIA